MARAGEWTIAFQSAVASCPLGGGASGVVVTFFVAVFVTLSRSQMRELTGRLALWRNSLDLALDYPLSGLGLASFEMPYSSYVLLVHVGYVTHAHNLLLDVWLGQGLLGLLGLGWLLIVAVRTGHNVTLAERRVRLAGGHPAARTGGRRVLWVRWSGCRAVVRAVCAVGQTGDGARGFPSGAASLNGERQSKLPILCGACVVLTVAALVLPRGRALIQANLGTLAQTRAELSVYQWPAWPIQDALRRSPEVDLAPAIAHYEAALALDPHNVAANRRLGQIELSRGQYDAARQHLETAFERAGTAGHAATAGRELCDQPGTCSEPHRSGGQWMWARDN